MPTKKRIRKNHKHLWAWFPQEVTPFHAVYALQIADPTQRENLGIIVQYKVKVKLCIGGPILGGDLVAELPFILMHPKPEEEDVNPILLSRSPNRGGERVSQNQGATNNSENADPEVPTTNLIQLDGDDVGGADDDIIFEDFARLRLKGAETEA